MREIKFRAWDVVELKIRKVARLDYPEWTVCVTDDYYNFQCERNSFKNGESDRFMLMQYTGLKDKNGVEIYEGDIIKHKSQIQFQCGDELSVVSYREGSFENCFFGSLYDNKNHCEVIGNIYENSELLK